MATSKHHRLKSSSLSIFTSLFVPGESWGHRLTQAQKQENQAGSFSGEKKNKATYICILDALLLSSSPSTGLFQFILQAFPNRIGIIFHTYPILTKDLQIHWVSDPTAFQVICIIAKLPLRCNYLIINFRYLLMKEIYYTYAWQKKLLKITCNTVLTLTCEQQNRSIIWGQTNQSSLQVMTEVIESLRIFTKEFVLTLLIAMTNWKFRGGNYQNTE